ncbi:MAG: FtsX-like permease family protein [Chitinophagaceae bacterium]
MNFLFAWRYFKSKKNTNAITIIAWVSMVAIAVVSAALIIVLSVFNGFEDLVKGLYADFYADVVVLPSKGKQLQVTQNQFSALKKINGIAFYSTVVEEKAVLKNGDAQSIIVLKGVEDNYTQVSNIANHIVRGKFILGNVEAPQMVLGAGVENALAADVETAINGLTVYMPNKANAINLQSADAFNSSTVVATATFLVQQEFDNKYCFTNIDFARYMLNIDASMCSYIELKLSDKANIKSISKSIKEVLGNNILVQTRYEQNKSLYAVMQAEKWIIYGVLSLILLIAAFNIIGSLTMLVLEKQKDIQILKAMGANNNLIRNIFLTEGILLAFVGGITGSAIATFICWIQLKFKIIKLGGVSFLIDYYPVKMMWQDYVLSFTTIAIISFVAAYLPSKKASLQPIQLKS